jgi:hypothetical protein
MSGLLLLKPFAGYLMRGYASAGSTSVFPYFTGEEFFQNAFGVERPSRQLPVGKPSK